MARSAASRRMLLGCTDTAPNLNKGAAWKGLLNSLSEKIHDLKILLGSERVPQLHSLRIHEIYIA